MPQSVSALLTKLQPDPWRESNPFSAEMSHAHQRIAEAPDQPELIAGALSDWLQKHQPCLFGRIAARHDRVSYCILTERDLQGSDVVIRDKIQEARTQWTREGFAGKKSGFVLLAVSPSIARATPDQNLKALAQRLGFLYLLQQVAPDRIYYDELFLEKSGDDRATWKWLAGVNYFCANGDGRWWQDHRIPGGLAFSVNSVGHLAKAGALAREELESTSRFQGVPVQLTAAARIDSLGKGLEFAMRTISMASEAVSGKATELLALSDEDRRGEQCPFSLPPMLADKDFRSYRSYYHTDFTLPSEYFLANVQRPAGCKARDMDLRYFFDADLENADRLTMGMGRRVRAGAERESRLKPTSQLIAASERLRRALNRQ